MSVYFNKTFHKAFGTFPLRGDQAREAVSNALEVGYRAFDTAQMYENESEVGEILSRSGIPREELLITTKVSNENFEKTKFISSVETSLKKLRVDTIDVLLLHWPPHGGDVISSLKLLEKAKELKLTYHIGVSNYTLSMLKTALEVLNTPIITNQVEFHPLLNQDNLLSGSARLGVPLSSYCSLARGKVFNDPVLMGLATQYGRSVSQIVLQWILQKGVSTNVMSTNVKNIQDNFGVSDFTLSAVDILKIDNLGQQNYRIVNKELVPWAPEWD